MNAFKAGAKWVLRHFPFLYRPTLLTRRSIVWAYRLFLDREPESASVIAEKRKGPIGNIPDLRRDLMLSKEFASKNPDLAPFPLGTVVIKGLPNGRRLFVDLGDSGIGGMIVRDRYEQDLLDLLPRLVQPGTTALDIGANIGLFSIYLADLVGETGRVVAFEPIRELAELLQKSIHENRFEDRVILETSAVGDRCGTTEILYVRDARNQGASYLVQQRAVCATPHEIRRVPMVTLDAYRFPGRVSFIKMDIEGAEPLCVRGGLKLLDRDRPIVLSEVHPLQMKRVAGVSPGDYLAQFALLRYRCWVQDRAGFSPVPPDYPCNGVLTMLFIPTENESTAQSLRDGVGHSF